MAIIQLDKKLITQDPRYNLYYYFGLIAFSSGLFCLTILPSITYYKFTYIESSFFTLPGIFLLLLSIPSWQLSKDTELYESVNIGCGLIFYSLYQIMIKSFFLITSNLILLILCLVAGLILIISAYDIINRSIRESFKFDLLVISSIVTVALTIIIILKQFAYV